MLHSCLVVCMQPLVGRAIEKGELLKLRARCSNQQPMQSKPKATHLQTTQILLPLLAVPAAQPAALAEAAWVHALSAQYDGQSKQQQRRYSGQGILCPQKHIRLIGSYETLPLVEWGVSEIGQHRECASAGIAHASSDTTGLKNHPATIQCADLATQDRRQLVQTVPCSVAACYVMRRPQLQVITHVARCGIVDQ